MEHNIVYRAAGRFGGWPANNGIWAWGNEIVVGFTLGYLDPEKRRGHPIQTGKRVASQARTLSDAYVGAKGHGSSDRLSGVW